MTKYVWAGVILQVVMVTTGHFVDVVYNNSAVLGLGIAFVICLWFGAQVAEAYGGAMLNGFVIGLIGALVGVLTSIFMGDQEWMLMTFAPAASGASGLVGGTIGFAFKKS